MLFQTFTPRSKVAKTFHVEPDEVDELEPEAEHQVNRVVGRKKGNGGVYLYGLEWKAQASADPEITFEQFDDLDGVCQQMVVEAFGAKAATERWKSKAKGKQKKHKKTGVSQRSAWHNSKQRRNKQNPSSKSPGGPKPVCHDHEVEEPEQVFSATPDVAAALMASVDKQWQTNREHNADDIAVFPQPAPAERIQQSLLRFRQMVSQPHINHLVCAVCAERVFASLVHTFRVTFDGRETQKTSKARARKRLAELWRRQQASG